MILIIAGIIMVIGAAAWLPKTARKGAWDSEGLPLVLLASGVVLVVAGIFGAGSGEQKERGDGKQSVRRGGDVITRVTDQLQTEQVKLTEELIVAQQEALIRTGRYDTSTQGLGVREPSRLVEFRVRSLDGGRRVIFKTTYQAPPQPRGGDATSLSPAKQPWIRVDMSRGKKPKASCAQASACQQLDEWLTDYDPRQDISRNRRP